MSESETIESISIILSLADMPPEKKIELIRDEIITLKKELQSSM